MNITLPMKTTTILLLAVGGLLVAGGCSSEPLRIVTPSGKPEVTIPGRRAEAVRQWLINSNLDKGNTLTADSDLRLVFERPARAAASVLLYGSRYDGQPNVRHTYTIVESEETTRVLVDVCMVTNPNSAFERRTPLTNATSQNSWQDYLEALRAALAEPEGDK